MRPRNRPLPRRLLSLLAALAAVALSSPLAAQRSRRSPSGPRVSRVSQAYREIKKRRHEILADYLKALYSAAESSAEKGLAELGEELTGRILKAVEPPRNRRKVRFKRQAGVAVAQGNAELRRLDEVNQAPLSPEEQKMLEEARGRVKKMRDRLGIREEEPRPAGSPGDEGTAEATGDGGTTSSAGGGKEERAIRDREKRARARMVKSVERLVNLCLQQGFPAHGYELLLWALKLDAENEKLRGILGQRRFKETWYTDYEYAKAAAGYQEHPDYGWVTPDQVKALRSGQAWYKGSWRPVELVERERQKWENRWVHETEHFTIETNAPLRDAVEFGREVERLYSFFYRVFIDFFAPGDPRRARALVFQRGMRLGKKLGLHYYRSYEHYMTEVKRDAELMKGMKHLDKEGLAQELKLLSESAGFYAPWTGKAYFFRGEQGPDLSTIYHEVTHQLFGETYEDGPGAPTWLIEGFGVFLEDPVIRGERLIAGAEPPPGVKPKEIVRDLNEFLKRYHDRALFHGPLRGDNYATGGAAVHFFLFCQGGIYRAPFMRYAREAYRNTLDESPTPVRKLYEYLGVTEEELQADWETFNASPDLFGF